MTAAPRPNFLFITEPGYFRALCDPETRSFLTPPLLLFKDNLCFPHCPRSLSLALSLFPSLSHWVWFFCKRQTWVNDVDSPHSHSFWINPHPSAKRGVWRRWSKGSARSTRWARTWARRLLEATCSHAVTWAVARLNPVTCGSRQLKPAEAFFYCFQLSFFFLFFSFYSLDSETVCEYKNPFCLTGVSEVSEVCRWWLLFRWKWKLRKFGSLREVWLYEKLSVCWLYLVE